MLIYLLTITIKKKIDCFKSFNKNIYLLKKIFDYALSFFLIIKS